MMYLLPVLAVLLSYVAVLWLRPKIGPSFKLLLAFSGAFLLALTIFELVPEVYAHGNHRTMGVFVMLGILLQIFLEFFSQGAEHGHIHRGKESARFPWSLFASLSIHAFLEGLPIHGNEPLLYGILVHKVPVALILGIYLSHSGISQTKAWIFMTFFACMTPLGTLAMDHLPTIQQYHAPLNALIIGVFLHISTVILFESSQGHAFNLRKLLVIILGMITAYLL